MSTTQFKQALIVSMYHVHDSIQTVITLKYDILNWTTCIIEEIW